MWTVLNVYEANDGFASIFTAVDDLGIIFLFEKQVNAATDLYVADEYDVYYTRDQFDFNDSMQRRLDGLTHPPPTARIIP